MSVPPADQRHGVRAGATHADSTLPIAIAAVALWALACVVVVIASPSAQRSARLMLETLVIGVPIGTGLYATHHPRTARFGYMLIGIGGVWSVAALGEASDPVLYSTGRVAAWMIFPLLVYALLAFPEGRLPKGTAWMLLAGVTTLILLLFVGTSPFVAAYPKYTPWASCRVDCPRNAFFVLGSEPAVIRDVIQPVRELLGVLLYVAVTAAVWGRLRRSTRLQRQMLAPVVILSVVSSAALAGFYLARWTDARPGTVDAFGVIWSLTVPGLAAAFAVGLARHRLLLGEILGRLSGDLAHLHDRGDLRRAVVAALDDPTVEILFRRSAPGRWTDADGKVTASPAVAADGRGVTRISDEGRPLAAIMHDPAIVDDEELMEAVSAQVLSSLRHDQVTGRLSALLGELDESRKRIATVADLERSRIERDLHDGAQQRLVLLRIKLSLTEELVRTDPRKASATMASLGDEIDAALDELRSLAHGVYPSVLSDRGLEDALRSMVIQSPLPVHLESRGLTRHAPELETAIYFTCVEALQNAFKHADGARRVWITLRETRVLRFEVGDDGPGFDPAATNGSSGLQNMRDRVEAVGGRLTVDSSPGHGTRIRGLVPLG